MSCRDCGGWHRLGTEATWCSIAHRGVQGAFDDLAPLLGPDRARDHIAEVVSLMLASDAERLPVPPPPRPAPEPTAEAPVVAAVGPVPTTAGVGMPDHASTPAAADELDTEEP